MLTKLLLSPIEENDMVRSQHMNEDASVSVGSAAARGVEGQLEIKDYL